MIERNIPIKKETLTVEFLPHCGQYRVWNYVVESWFDTWDAFVTYVKVFNLMEQYEFISYSEEIQKLLNNLKRDIINECA